MARFLSYLNPLVAISIALTAPLIRQDCAWSDVPPWLVEISDCDALRSAIKERFGVVSDLTKFSPEVRSELETVIAVACSEKFAQCGFKVCRKSESSSSELADSSSSSSESSTISIAEAIANAERLGRELSHLIDITEADRPAPELQVTESSSESSSESESSSTNIVSTSATLSSSSESSEEAPLVALSTESSSEATELAPAPEYLMYDALYGAYLEQRRERIAAAVARERELGLTWRRFSAEEEAKPERGQKKEKEAEAKRDSEGRPTPPKQETKSGEDAADLFAAPRESEPRAWSRSESVESGNVPAEGVNNAGDQYLPTFEGVKTPGR